MLVLESDSVGRLEIARQSDTAVPAAVECRPRLRIARFPPTPDENPYQRLLYDHLGGFGFELDRDAAFTLAWLWRARRRPAYLHFHWRMDRIYRRSWLRLALFAARLQAARLLGYRLVWTIHEAYPHARPAPRLDRAAGRMLARACHVLLAHDDGHVSAASAALGCPDGRIGVVPHGSYIGVYPRGRSRAAVREELRVPSSAFAFLCFGGLQAYKRIDLLLRAFESFRDPGAYLVVAGRVKDERVAAEVEEASRRDSRIVTRFGFAPDEQVAEFFEACDAAVVARDDGWSSGSLILALSHGLPVVAANMPAYRRLLEEGSAGWLFEPGNAASLRAALAAAASDREGAKTKGEVALAKAHSLSWPDIAEMTAAHLLAAEPERDRLAGS